jgi:hypothetical protein
MSDEAKNKERALQAACDKAFDDWNEASKAATAKWNSFIEAKVKYQQHVKETDPIFQEEKGTA